MGVANVPHIPCDYSRALFGRAKSVLDIIACFHIFSVESRMRISDEILDHIHRFWFYSVYRKKQEFEKSQIFYALNLVYACHGGCFIILSTSLLEKNLLRDCSQ